MPIEATFIVVFRDAADRLPALLCDLEAQDYPKECLEVLLVDGMSADGSRALAEAFQKKHPELVVRVLENKGKTLACGWNVALAGAAGSILVRVDAHGGIPASFIRKCVETVRQGHEIAGGPIVLRLPEAFLPRLLALAERSRFGGGAAAFRRPGPARHVDTLAHAAYRREVFAKVGGYHELLGRTEDNEMHWRMKQAGCRFWLTPEIESYHRARASLRGLLLQKFGNGYWIGVTLAAAPQAFGLRHFVPGVFVAALAASLAAARFGAWRPLALLMGAYVAAAGAAAFFAVRGERPLVRLAFPALMPVFFLAHTAYGLGTFSGLLLLPAFANKLKKYKVPRPL